MRPAFRPTISSTSTRGDQGLQQPDSVAASRPSWLFPAAVGAAVVVLLGAVMAVRVLRTEQGTPVGPYAVRLSRDWLAFSTEQASRLGDPIWSERTYEGREHCVGFVYAIACRSNRPGTQGTLYAYELVDLGRRALPPEQAPQPGLAPAPIVQARRDDMEQQGIDWHYWYGLIISGVFCVGAGAGDRGGECLTYTTNQVLRWTQGSSDPRDVRPSPLGLHAPRP